MRRYISSIALLSITLSAMTAQANLLVDGSFEAATEGTTISNSPWVLTANTPAEFGSAAHFQTSGFASSDGTTGVWYRPFAGTTATGDLSANSTLTQSVVATQYGTYNLTFDAAREANFLASEWYVELASNTPGGVADTANLLTAAMPNGNFGTVSTQFALSLNNVRPADVITVIAIMTGGRNANMNPQSGFVDNFNLTHDPTSVPEPSAVLLVGLGALGLLGLRWR